MSVQEDVCRVAAFLTAMLLQGDYETIEATDLWSLVYVRSVIFNVEMDDTPTKGVCQRTVTTVRVKSHHLGACLTELVTRDGLASRACRLDRKGVRTS